MGLHPTLAAIKRNLPSVARDLGFSARVTSAYRSTKKQAWLYDRWLRGLQSYPVAPPGTSDHERGLALDVVSTDTNKLVDLLTSVGLSWAGPSDPVHFSLVGPQIAAQPQKQSFYVQGLEKGLEAVAKVNVPMPLQMVGFWQDPIGTIKENVGWALDIFGFL